MDVNELQNRYTAGERDFSKINLAGANLSGIILEALLYSKVGRSLEVWAHEKH